jgi:hypothetical protein
MYLKELALSYVYYCVRECVIVKLGIVERRILSLLRRGAEKYI